MLFFDVSTCLENYKYISINKFLLFYYSAHGTGKMADESPNTTGQYKDAFVVRMTWRRIYTKYYVDHCKKVGILPFSPSKFCAARVQYRPQYRRHRKVGRKSWHHMECSECVANQAAVDRAKDTESRRAAEVAQQAHWDHQQEFRANYDRTIAKVCAYTSIFIYCFNEVCCYLPVHHEW